ncbi:amino acid transporter [Maudiozyma humilis]|uniref:Amino acid transporter n=1 Tax=Maudiozyma humilis TaxID=51915 RepID=A0AAV5RYH5_MAUHU|nr:amino acid transporter [Kazachstania humilis]
MAQRFDSKEAKGNSATTEIRSAEQDNEVEYFEMVPTGTGNGRPSSEDSRSGNTNRRGRFARSYPGKKHFRDFVDSFKRAEDPQLEQPLEDIDVAVSRNTIENINKEMASIEGAGRLSSAEDRIGGAAAPGEQYHDDTDDKFKKTIKPRHVIMISLGTGIGTGLLVGNGSTLANGGPASLVIGYAIMGSCIYCIIQAVGEMAVAYISLIGGFNAYPAFIVDPALGFSVAWVYCLQWLCVCPLELVTASMTIKYWTTKVDPDVFVIIFYVLIVAINVVGGAAGYAEAEFFFNSCKILMMAGFFILGIIIICGGAGNDGYIGGKYWHDPGAFRGDKPIDHFKGVVGTLVNAAFSFGQSEFIAITASEQSNPRKAIPSAAKKIIYRALCVYMASIVLIGFLVPWNSDQLLGSGGGGVKASPYVLAVSTHGVRVVPHFINAVILLSVLSVANSAFYSSSRMLLTLAHQGWAPKFFDYVDRAGRPTMGIAAAMLFAVIAFCATSPKEDEVFVWLLAISGLSQIFTWLLICLSHIRFRYAMKVQGRSTGELGFKSQVGVWGSGYAALFMFLILIGQFWVAIAPIGEGKLDAKAFFENYLAMPILIALYFGYKIWKRDWSLYIKADKIDLVHGRTIYDEELLRQEREELEEKLRNGPFWKRAYAFWC